MPQQYDYVYFSSYRKRCRIQKHSPPLQIIFIYPFPKREKRGGGKKRRRVEERKEKLVKPHY